MEIVPFTSREMMQEKTEAIVARCTREVSTLLPEAEIHQVGGASLPSAWLTGEIDLIVRVPVERFGCARLILAQRYPLDREFRMTDSFCAFRDDSSNPLLRIQLTIQDGPWGVTPQMGWMMEQDMSGCSQLRAFASPVVEYRAAL